MDVSDPVSEKPQWRELLRRARVLDDRTWESLLIAVTTQADAPGKPCGKGNPGTEGVPSKCHSMMPGASAASS